MVKRLTLKQKHEVIERLKRAFPEAKAELKFSNPFELLIATILSAQCTDVRVNKVTASLFLELKTPQDYLNLGLEELEKRIHSCGFYHNKAKNILGACQMLLENYEGEVPASFEELLKLPGVGRKTANVVVSNAFGIPGIAVDTHVFRVSNRVGLAKAKTPDETEFQLQQSIPREDWTLAHHLLIFQGRRVCKSQRPLCESCSISSLCLAYLNGKTNY